MNTIICEIQNGDHTHYDQFENQYKKIIYMLIFRYHLEFDMDEYFQIGRITLYECAMKFDESFNTKFVSYFTKSMAGIFSKHRDKVRYESEYVDTVPDEEDRRAKFQYLISNLSIDKQNLLTDYYYYGMGVEAMAVKYGYVHSMISHLLNKVLEELRDEFRTI